MLKQSAKYKSNEKQEAKITNIPSGLTGNISEMKQTRAWFQNKSEIQQRNQPRIMTKALAGNMCYIGYDPYLRFLSDDDLKLKSVSQTGTQVLIYHLQLDPGN